MFPQRIFKTWKTTYLPEQWKAYQKSWKTLHPSWTYVFHTDSDNRRFILSHFPSLIDTYDALPYNINRVDFVRYAYLYVHGGIYADLDCECIKSLDTLKKKKETEIILAYDSLKHLECAFMISTPKQPLWLHVLHEIHKRLYEPSLKLQLYGALSRSTYILNLTGPSMLEEVLKSTPVKGVEIFPSDAFYPKQWNDTTHHDGRAIATAQTYVVDITKIP
jgi:mannosyltransferase OCH1-like enzyme